MAPILMAGAAKATKIEYMTHGPLILVSWL
jgi:hypothetical protein